MSASYAPGLSLFRAIRPLYIALGTPQCFSCELLYAYVGDSSLLCFCLHAVCRGSLTNKSLEFGQFEACATSYSLAKPDPISSPTSILTLSRLIGK